MKLLAIAMVSAVLVWGGLLAGVKSEERGESSAQTKASSGDEIQIRQLERAWNQAEAKQEVKEVGSLLADTLVYTDYDGTFMNKEQYMKWIVAPEQKADHIYDEGLSVQVYGEAAVATGIYRETGTNKGKPYAIRSRFTDTWIKRSGVWQCVASQSTLLK